MVAHDYLWGAYAEQISRRCKAVKAHGPQNTRRRRDLDGRNAVVSRIAAAPPIGLHALGLPLQSRLGLGLATLVRGV